MSAVDQLLRFGSPPFSDQPTETAIEDFGPREVELLSLLSRYNGGFFFNQSLRLFPTSDCQESYSLKDWNSDTLWRSTYGSIPSNVVFFAEDLFGYQFGILDNNIVRLDPETAEISHFSKTLDEFANIILGDTDYYSGYSLSRSWQSENGKLNPRYRLIPKIPFVLGGEFEIKNLYAVEAAKSMRIRGPIARKICNLSDGSILEFDLPN